MLCFLYVEESFISQVSWTLEHLTVSLVMCLDLPGYLKPVAATNSLGLQQGKLQHMCRAKPVSKGRSISPGISGGECWFGITPVIRMYLLRMSTMTTDPHASWDNWCRLVTTTVRRDRFRLAYTLCTNFHIIYIQSELFMSSEDVVWDAPVSKLTRSVCALFRCRIIYIPSDYFRRYLDSTGRFLHFKDFYDLNRASQWYALMKPHLGMKAVENK